METVITKEQVEKKKKKKMVTLVSSDRKKFVVEQKVAEQCSAIKMVMDCCGIESAFPVEQVRGDVLSSILEYCEKHAEEEDEKTVVMEEWEREFMEKSKKDLVFFHDLMLGAHFLHIQELMDLTAKTMADMMRMKTPEQIRQMFGIKNDFTLEQEERFIQEFGWAFQ